MFFSCKKKKAESSHIFIKDMMVDTQIGVFDDEKGRSQRVRISVTAETSIWPNAAHDNINETVSYDVIVQHIFKNTRGQHIHLVETLAENIARDCLAEKHIVKVTVRVEKPDIYPFAIAGAEITRLKVR